METDRDKRDLVQQRKFVHRERFHNKKKNMLFPFSKQKKLFGLYRGVGGCPPQTNVFTFVVEPFPLSFLVKVSAALWRAIINTKIRKEKRCNWRRWKIEVQCALDHHYCSIFLYRRQLNAQITCPFGYKQC